MNSDCARPQRAEISISDFPHPNRRAIHHIKNGTHKARKELTVVFRETISQQCSGDLKGNRKEQGLSTVEFLYHSMVMNILTNFKT